MSKLGSGGLGFPLGLRRLTGLKGRGFLDPLAPPAVADARRADPRAGRPKRSIISSFCAMRTARRRSYSVKPCVCVHVEKQGACGGSVSVARGLVVGVRRAVREEKSWSRGVTRREEEGRGARERARERGGCAHLLGLDGLGNRGDRADVRRLACQVDACGCAWNCERGRNGILSEKSAASGFQRRFLTSVFHSPVSVVPF